MEMAFSLINEKSYRFMSISQLSNDSLITILWMNIEYIATTSPLNDSKFDFVYILVKFIYRISANSFRSFLEAGVQQVFKGGNYSREETVAF